MILVSPSVVALVDSRLSLDLVHLLLPGSGERCDQRLVRAFYDLVQAALSKSAPVTLLQFYLQLATFAEIAFVAVTVGVVTRFFVSHYIFRWRTAMNEYYVAHWPQLQIR